jgi:hypothetical protein
LHQFPIFCLAATKGGFGFFTGGDIPGDGVGAGFAGDHNFAAAEFGIDGAAVFPGDFCLPGDGLAGPDAFEIVTVPLGVDLGIQIE